MHLRKSALQRENPQFLSVSPDAAAPHVPSAPAPLPTLFPKLPPLPASHSPWVFWSVWIRACFLLCSYPATPVLGEGRGSTAALQRLSHGEAELGGGRSSG